MAADSDLRVFPQVSCILLALSLATGCSGGAGNDVTLSGPTMGTQFTVKIVIEGTPTEDDSSVIDDIKSVLKHVNDLMSTYQPDSELSRFNAWHKTESFPASAETLEVFTLAREISEASDGAFDVTVGPLVNAWGFGADGAVAEWPTDEEIKTLQKRVGYALLEIDSGGGALRKKFSELYCDLSAIAKGYGVDKVAELLNRLGYENYMVEIGGEVRTRGLNASGKAWQIAIEKPDPRQRAMYRILALKNAALATSGDYRNYDERDGKRVSHTIDPRTGRPVTHDLASVSVVHDTCAVSDGWATALMVLGPQDGYRLAVKMDLAALFIFRDEGDVYSHKATPAFETLFGAK